MANKVDGPRIRRGVFHDKAGKRGLCPRRENGSFGFRRASLILILAVLLAACGQRPAADGGYARITNSGEVIRSLRAGLKAHAASITVSFDYGENILAELGGVVEAWMQEAMAETEASDEGDYIRYQTGGYTYTSSYAARDGRYFYEVKVVPEYFGYRSQEDQVTGEVQRRRRSYGFLPWTSRAERIRRIYGDLCRTVTYDKVHQKNPYDHRGSTAYAALIQGTATCQGYCTALYRLLREEGIPCRIVTGRAGEEDLHAWVIAELDGLWYLLDPTWDAGQDTYLYCMAGSAETGDHVPGEAFEGDFAEEHPMAERGLFSEDADPADGGPLPGEPINTP